jgi:hypothetical protein
MSSFLERDALEADTQEQRDWAVSQPEFDEPQFELPPHLQEQAEDVEDEPDERELENPDPFFGFDPQVREDVHEKGWFYPLAQYIYFKRYIPLRERMVAAFDALQGKSERNRRRS